MLCASTASWQFDAFALEEATQGHGLSALGYYLMHETGLMARFRLPGHKLARFLRAVEGGYRSNPYVSDEGERCGTWIKFKPAHW